VRENVIQFKPKEGCHLIKLPILECCRTIQLTKGQNTLVDAGDYQELARHKWNAHRSGGYAARQTSRTAGKIQTVYMHRQIFCTPAGVLTDHKNGDKRDNRRSNLRAATCSENMANRRRRSDGTARFKGVRFDRRNGKWSAQIQWDGCRQYLGRFETEAEAAVAYNLAAVQMHGAFARINVLSA
jgi:HNH endonuclease